MSRVQTEIHYNDADRQWTFNRVQDVEPILEANKVMQGERQAMEWGRLIGVIPNVFIEKWINEDGVNYLRLPPDEFGRLIKRKLRDPQYAHLRAVGKL